jgi:hypothetical protein
MKTSWLKMKRWIPWLVGGVFAAVAWAGFGCFELEQAVLARQEAGAVLDRLHETQRLAWALQRHPAPEPGAETLQLLLCGQIVVLHGELENSDETLRAMGQDAFRRMAPVLLAEGGALAPARDTAAGDQVAEARRIVARAAGLSPTAHYSRLP